MSSPDGAVTLLYRRDRPRSSPRRRKVTIERHDGQLAKSEMAPISA